MRVSWHSVGLAVSVLWLKWKRSFKCSSACLDLMIRCGGGEEQHGFELQTLTERNGSIFTMWNRMLMKLMMSANRNISSSVIYDIWGRLGLICTNCRLLPGARQKHRVFIPVIGQCRTFIWVRLPPAQVEWNHKTDETTVTTKQMITKLFLCA